MMAGFPSGGLHVLQTVKPGCGLALFCDFKSQIYQREAGF